MTCCLHCADPVFLVFRVSVSQMVDINLQEESGFLRYLMNLRMAQPVYLVEKPDSILDCQIPEFIVMEHEVPEEPLCMCHMQDLSDEASHPVSGVDAVRTLIEVVLLKTEEVCQNTAFQEVPPANEVLVMCKSGHLCRHLT